MKLKEFLAEVASIEGWYVNDDGEIRCYTPQFMGCCPLTAVVMKKYDRLMPEEYWEDAAALLGISRKLAGLIVCSADDDPLFFHGVHQNHEALGEVVRKALMGNVTEKRA